MNRVVDVLRSYQFPFGHELQLQDAVEEALTENQVEYTREFVLGPGERVDFMAGGVGIECKVDGSAPSVLAQLLRYAEKDAITEIVLLTTRSTHRFAMTELLGKPFHLIRINGL